MPPLTRLDYLAAETPVSVRPVRDRGRVVLLSPDNYHVGMSRLAVHTLYALLNNAGLICERAFPGESAPGQQVRSLETDTPLAGFDYVLVTSSFELDWLALPAMLAAGGVPPLRAERGPRHPLVIAGGPAITMNPEPLSDLVDVSVIGEVEPIAEGFVRALGESGSREEVVARLGALPGVYVPAVEAYAPALGARRQRVARLWAPSLDEFTTESVLLTPHTEFGNRFLIEVGRGCARTCRFCLARRIYHPLRVRRPAMLLERIAQAAGHTPRVGLVGAAISDYPWVEELFGVLREREASVSVSSVRADSVSLPLLEALSASGQETLTVAPETGDEALRERIGKGLTEDDLVRCLDLGLTAGIRRYKLYFMLGLPEETPEETLAIPPLVARLHRAFPQAALAVSIGPYVPKPHTPFERVAMLKEAELRRRLGLVTAQLHHDGIRDVSAGSARWAAAQAVLSRGGRELGPALIAASLAGGGFSALKAAVRATGRDWRTRLAAQQWEPGAAPWEVVTAQGAGAPR